VEMLKTIASTLGPLVGAIIAFYFKEGRVE